jgi:hypothetical protein
LKNQNAYVILSEVMKIDKEQISGGITSGYSKNDCNNSIYFDMSGIDSDYSDAGR